MKEKKITVRAINAGEKYRHYKGKDYIVLNVATHTETMEELVIYQALYGDKKIWARPKAMFLDQVEIDGEIINRFEKM